MAPSPDVFTQAADTAPPTGTTGEPVVRILTDIRALTSDAPQPAGTRWKLAEPGRQLDANLVHLPPRQRVDAHTEPDLDVLLLVVAGHGTVGSTGATGARQDQNLPQGLPQSLADGSLLWLPRGSTRSLTAGEAGMSYLTVHPRRPGMQIRPHPDIG